MGLADMWTEEDKEIRKRATEYLFEGLPMLRRETELLYLMAKGQAEAENARKQSAGDSYVAANVLRSQRGQTAAQCNKFLKKYGTESVEPIEGKVRFRKPNKKTLEIHAADWAKFWQEVGRRQSEALDEVAIQEFLAKADDEKAKIKSARKLGRSSSGQVPDITRILR